MASKAAKRARRRTAAGDNDNGGRPLREGVIRYPGKDGKPGRIDYRAMETKGQTMATVTEARMRHHGLDKAAAQSRSAGYSLGRLHNAGQLDARGLQLSAGNRMHEDVLRYYALTGMPSPSPRAMDPNRVHGIGGEARQDAIRKATNARMMIETVLGCVDRQGAPVRTLSWRLVIMDEDTQNWTPSMIAHVRRGLDALVHHYGITECDPELT